MIPLSLDIINASTPYKVYWHEASRTYRLKSDYGVILAIGFDEDDIIENAEIVLSKALKVLTVPESAIEFSGDSTFVYIVKGSGEKKTYSRKQVTTGLSDGVNIEIKKGLSLKDKVRGPQVVADNKDDEE